MRRIDGLIARIEAAGNVISGSGLTGQLAVTEGSEAFEDQQARL